MNPVVANEQSDPMAAMRRRLDELPELDAEEVLRYSRQLVMPELGVAGQRRLKAGRVLLVGAGGLGSPAAMYLTAAGIGHLGLVDFDTVDASNLHRQLLYGTSDVGRRKLEAARERLNAVNPHTDVETYETRLTSANALEIMREYDVVVDGTDNFATRYLTNDACVLLGKPNVYGSIFRFEGQASVFAVPGGPCYRCLFREPPPPGLVPTCAEGGVLGVLPGLVGMIQATEALKLVLGSGDPLIGRLLLVDALAMRFRTLQLRADPTCPACGTREITELIDYDEFCGTRGANGTATGGDVITPRELAERLVRNDDVQLVDVREPGEWDIARLPGARLVPLATLAESLHSLDRERDIVVYCRVGVRGERAAQTLRAAGFTRVRNLAGGINRWSEDVDPSVPKY